MAIPLEYWATMAQVIPIAALAVVVEARALSSRWDATTPDWLRIFQSIIWATLLLTLSIGELLAVDALRGRDVAEWLPRALSIVVGSAFGNLFLGPALELLAKGNARPLAYLFTRHPIVRWRMRHLSRARRKLDAVSRENIKKLSVHESSLLEALSTLDNTLEGLASADAQMEGAKEARNAFIARYPDFEVRSSLIDEKIARSFEETAAARVINAEARARVAEALERTRAQIEETRVKSADVLKEASEIEERLRDAFRQEQEALRLSMAAYPSKPNPERSEAAPAAETDRSDLVPPAEDRPADEP